MERKKGRSPTEKKDSHNNSQSFGGPSLHSTDGLSRFFDPAGCVLDAAGLF